MLRILIFVLPLFLHVLASADSLKQLTEQAIDRASQFVPDAKQVEEGAEQAARALDKSRTAIDEATLYNGSGVNLDLFNLQSSDIDIGALAGQGQQILQQDIHEDRYETHILVFVSSSMPDELIGNYLLQASRIQAPIVFRGLINDSMIDTRTWLSRIIENKPALQKTEPTILIDPTLYSRFAIADVPAIVATHADIPACLDNQCTTPEHDKVWGDVSLAWALGLMARQTERKDFKVRLKQTVKRLEHPL